MIHRLTLRQINENPTLMSDEVFVPVEEYDALRIEFETLKRSLQDPEAVHVAMLRGTIARISMRQCAHLYGDRVMEAFNRWDELRGDIKTASDVLVDFEGTSIWEQAQGAVEEIESLRRSLHGIRGINEQNVQHIGDLEAALRDARRKIEKLSYKGGSHGEEARQASGSSGPVEERTDAGDKGKAATTEPKPVARGE